jgi:hypothetical protein
MFIVQTLLPIFGQTILPVFLVAACGFLLARLIKMDTRSIGRTVFYLFTPALVFRSLYQVDVDYSVLGRIALLAFLVTLATAVIAWIVSRGHDKRRRAALVLTTGMSNAGNMGLPISLFALGETGLALATIYYVTISFLGNTLGVVVTSAGTAPLGTAIKRSLKVPALYSAVLGLGLGMLQVPLPVGIFRAIDLMGDAAIAAMLVLLGILLTTAPIAERQAVLTRAVIIRLVGGPLIALALSLLLGINGMERSVIILQSAMPTAVMTTVLATEYDTAPRFVATVVFFTTAISMITISLVLWLIL